MFRPQIKVCDCTIRDGGLMNDSHFPKEMVRHVFSCLARSGVDIIELGYRNSRTMFDPAKFGLWLFTDDDLIREVTDGVEFAGKIAVMQDAHKAFAEDLAPADQSPVSLVRVATYVHDIDKAIHLANTAVEKGYEATINVMSISHAIERELDEALQQIEEETKVSAVYIVDSFGNLYSEDVDFYVDKFRRYLKSCELGIHCHNPQQLAFANTIQGIIRNVNWLDGTLYGLGRGAGNCPIELLMSFLKNPKFNIAPLLEAIGKEIIPLQKDIFWGYSIPYMLSGVLNIHPKEAMRIMALPDSDPEKVDYVSLFHRLGDV